MRLHHAARRLCGVAAASATARCGGPVGIGVSGTRIDITGAVTTGSCGTTPPALRSGGHVAMYRRYMTARDVWYKAQPRGSQSYRKAMGLYTARPWAFIPQGHGPCAKIRQRGLSMPGAGITSKWGSNAAWRTVREGKGRGKR